MRFSIFSLLLSFLLLSACGGGIRDSRLNPVNWFGASRSEPVETVQTVDGEVVEVNPLIGERKQSQIIAANRTSIQKTGIFRRRGKEIPYEGTLVAQVTDLDIKPTATGAIVSVTGLAARQGAYDVRLITTTEDGSPVDGVLTYEFLALQPVNTPQGPERTRRIQAAAALSNDDLEEIREIRVVSRQNIQSSRRR